MTLQRDIAAEVRNATRALDNDNRRGEEGESKEGGGGLAGVAGTAGGVKSHTDNKVMEFSPGIFTVAIVVVLAYLFGRFLSRSYFFEGYETGSLS